MNYHSILRKYVGRQDELRDKLRRHNLIAYTGRGSAQSNAATLATFYRNNPKPEGSELVSNMFNFWESQPQVNFKPNTHLDRLSARNQMVKAKRESNIQGSNLRHFFNQFNPPDSFLNVQDDFTSRFLRSVDFVENLTLSDLHEMTFDLSSMDPLTMRLFGNRFMELMETTLDESSGKYKKRIAIHMDVIDYDGTKANIIRNISRKNIRFFKKMFKNNGEYVKFMNIGNPSDIEWMAKKVKVLNMTIYDIDQLPDELKEYEFNDGAYWNWYLDTDRPEFDLSKFQIFKNEDEIDDECCLVYALRKSGLVKPSILNDIARDLFGKKYIETSTVKHIAEKYMLNIHLVIAEEHRTRAPRKYGVQKGPVIEICLMNHHYFIRSKTRFNVQYFKYRNDERLKQFPLEKQLLVQTYYNGEWVFYNEAPEKDIVEVIRKLFNFKAFKVIEKYEEIIKRRKLHQIKNVEFEINANNFKRYEFNEHLYLSEFYSKIPDLYQINGNFATAVMNCMRGGRVLLRNKLKIKNVVSLDFNSMYSAAESKCGIQTGIPKVLGEMSFGELLSRNYSSASLWIEVTSFTERTFPVINDLHIGRLWVDLLTLNDLIKYHHIEGHVINGFYFDTPIDYSIKDLIYEMFEMKKKASSQEEKDDIKLRMNKIYGMSLKRPRFTKKKLVRKDLVFRFIKLHYNQVICAKKLDDEFYEVEIYKKYVDHYNLAHFGVMILSMARHMMNEIIYKCEDHGIDVLYSVTDSLFIKQDDLSKFNELFPGLIGDDIGQLKPDMNGHEYASEAIFVSKGTYLLKYPDGEYKIRAVRRSKSDIIEYGVEKWFEEQFAKV